MKTRRPILRDLLLGAVLFVAALALYVRTLAPSVAFLFDDTLEFQYVVPRLGILHPTGYPFYTLLGKLFTLVVPFRDPAFRLNLLSALIGALAVAMVYFVARHLTAHRLAAFLGALVFAVGQTFWSQAVIAETYTTQMLIVAVLLYLALIWREEVGRGNTAQAQRRFLALAFVMGLGLAHHRLILLTYPAFAVYGLFVQRSTLKDWRLLAKATGLFLLPLVLYLYLPLRGAVGSADGTYKNTLSGFFEWITGQAYTVFLDGDPFQVQRDAAYYWTLVQNQFTLIGLALAVVGIVWLGHKPREWVLLVLALVIQAVFVFNYHVANVYVHFLTTFLLLALFIAAGADGLLTVFTHHRAASLWNASRGAFYVSAALVSLLLFLIPVNLLISNYPVTNLSDKWDMHDYGLDILSQPLEPNATIIGIQGEITLVRYFQETQGLRPDIQTIAADKDQDRLAAVTAALAQNHAVYLTRPLNGVEKKYSLGSQGPLIRVNPQPVAGDKNALLLGDDMGEGIKLLGREWTSIPGQHAENGRMLRVTLHWFAPDRIAKNANVSLKLVRADRHIVGQIDRRPVLGAYPTNAWRAGEVILDTYDLPIFLGAPPGEYSVNLTLYDPESGAVIGSRDLGKIALGPDVVAPRARTGPDRDALQNAWNIEHAADADFSGFTLAGYSLDANAPIRPGDALPLTLLWRAGKAQVNNSVVARVWLEDAQGKAMASRDIAPGDGFPVPQWLPNQYVRDWPSARVPANVADGKYVVKLAAARNGQLLGTPFGATVTRLGEVVVKNRARTLTPPAVAHPLEVTFDQKIKLLGYELKRDVPQRGAALTLYWKALAPMNTSYVVFLHMLDSQNNIVFSADGIPGSGELPTTGWVEEEYIADLRAFTLPPDLPTGGYPLEIGWYDPATGARLKTADGKDALIITSINDP